MTTDTIELLLAEGPMTAAAAAKLLTTALRAGRPVHPGTVCRWISPGLLMPNGRRLRLEGFRAGRKWLTSRAAVLRFLAAQQEIEQEAATVRSPGEREKANAAVLRELDELGAR
jgi:hypothetical protein